MKHTELRKLIREELQLILENQISDFNNILGNKLKELLPFIQVKSNGVMASTHQPKSEPAVRIDSKLKPTALWIMTKEGNGEFHAIIKTIINNKENDLKGYGQKLLQALIDTVKEQQKSNPETKYIIDIDHDVSGGFWDYFIKKYPEIDWKFTN